MVRGSSVAGTLGVVPLVTFMSEQEKVIAARLAEIRTLADVRWTDHLASHSRDNELTQRALMDRIEAREENDSMRWESHERAHSIERGERDKAVTTIDNRLAEMNNLRDQINSERATYISRNELSLVTDKIDKQIDMLADRMLRIELGISNLQGRMAMAGIALTVLMFVVGIGARFLE